MASFGQRRYRGPVHTLEQAALADLPVQIRCESCGSTRQMHAFEFQQKISDRWKDKPFDLLEPTPGFFCKTCRKKTRIIVFATLEKFSR
jgi:hypothetical protein